MTNSPVCVGDEDVNINEMKPYFLRQHDDCHTKLPSLDNNANNSNAQEDGTNIYPRWIAPAAARSDVDDNDNDDDNNTTFAVTQETHPEEHRPRWRPRRRRRSTDADEDHEEHAPHPPRTRTEPERHGHDDPDSDTFKDCTVFKITSTSTDEEKVNDQDQDNIEQPCAWKNMHIIPMSHSHCPPPQQQEQDDSLRLDLLLRKADADVSHLDPTTQPCPKNRAVIPEEEDNEREQCCAVRRGPRRGSENYVMHVPYGRWVVGTN
jgi:hypothetical protein